MSVSIGLYWLQICLTAAINHTCSSVGTELCSTDKTLFSVAVEAYRHIFLYFYLPYAPMFPPCATRTVRKQTVMKALRINGSSACCFSLVGPKCIKNVTLTPFCRGWIGTLRNFHTAAFIQLCFFIKLSMQLLFVYIIILRKCGK